MYGLVCICQFGKCTRRRVPCIICWFGLYIICWKLVHICGIYIYLCVLRCVPVLEWVCECVFVFEEMLVECLWTCVDRKITCWVGDCRAMHHQQHTNCTRGCAHVCCISTHALGMAVKVAEGCEYSGYVWFVVYFICCAVFGMSNVLSQNSVYVCLLHCLFVPSITW